MINSFSNNNVRKIKSFFIVVFAGILFMTFYSNTYSKNILTSFNTVKTVKTNKYDSEIEDSDNKANVELKKTLDITKIETKKLEIQDKAILDVNKSEQMRMELEMKKLELIEAQKLKNDLEKAKLQVELKKYEIDKNKSISVAKSRAAADKKAKDIEIYKAILEN